jgi:hypothetical protein
MAKTPPPFVPTVARNVTSADFDDPWQRDDLPMDRLSESWEQAAAQRVPLLQLLARANLTIHDLNVLRQLPYWSDVTDLYGSEPVVLGMETCQRFRDAVPAEHRYVGVAGQMNVGTNALGQYLKGNLAIPQNGIAWGMLREIPWGKHSWESLRYNYLKAIPNQHELVLPVVVVRDPYFWMQSMCASPYTMQWDQSSIATHCPNLVDHGKDVEVRIKWGTSFERTWRSLAHVWSSWYREYLEASYPRLIVRFEDLLFHTPYVLDQIRECAGAEWVYDEFQFVTQAVKTHPYFEKYKKQVGLIGAMMSYGQDHGKRLSGMTADDIAYAKAHLDADLMLDLSYDLPW